MQTFEYKVKIEAENKQQAEQALDAMFALKKSLSHEDLRWLAKVAKEKPHLMAAAKKWA